MAESVIVMDFVDPSHGPIAHLASAYFFHVLPTVAGWLAGRRELYRKLVATTRAMHGRESLERIVRDAGLRVEQTRVMGFGLVVAVVGQRG